MWIKILLFAHLLISVPLTANFCDTPDIMIAEEEVEFYNGKIKLSATLLIPDKKGTHPAIAITHGSGRDSKSHAGFIALANMLAKKGYVVLIFDKRGVGKSTGGYLETPDMAVPAGDLVEAIKYLKTRKEVDKSRMGVYGHSQGGWVAPLASTICKDISFVVVACGGGTSVRETVLFGLRAELKSKGFSPEEIDNVIIFARPFYTYLGTGIGYQTMNEIYSKAIHEKWFSFFREMKFGDKLPPPSMLKEPPFNFFKMMNYDPQGTLRFIDVPTLVILGGKDTSVPSDKSKQAWDDAFYASGQSNKLSVIWLADEDHYDFVRSSESVIYKKSFEDPLIKWLIQTIGN